MDGSQSDNMVLVNFRNVLRAEIVVIIAGIEIVCGGIRYSLTRWFSVKKLAYLK